MAKSRGALWQVSVLALAWSVAQLPGSAKVSAAIDQNSIVGHADTVVNDVEGRLGEVQREIVINADVFSQEVISTGADAAAKLIFRDGTEFVLGANSRVTLDRFVYDPETATGQIVMNMISGVFEFATGLMAPSSYDLRTPFATLAIRGTRLVVDVNRQFVFVASSSSSGELSGIDLTLPNGQTLSRSINEGVFLNAAGEPELCEADSCPTPSGTGQDGKVAPPEARGFARQVIDVPVSAPREIAAPAGRGLVVLFGDLSRLELEPGARIRVERFAYDRRSRDGELRVAILAGRYAFRSGKLPSDRRHFTTPLGAVQFRGTCVDGAAEHIVVRRCPDLVEAKLTNGSTQMLAEQQGMLASLAGLAFCLDTGCSAYLGNIQYARALIQSAQAGIEPGAGSTAVAPRPTITRFNGPVPVDPTASESGP